MAAPTFATTARTRPAPRLGIFSIAIVALIAAAVLAVAIWTQVASTPDVRVVNQPYGAGYPLHGGLAGPSAVVTNQAGSFAPGYPLHGGLAGPSQADEGE